jgi:hypothetical protein
MRKARNEKGSKAVVLYGAVHGAQYLTVATSARNYGIRFVKNVLVEESHSIWSGKAGSSRQRYCDGKGLAMLVSLSCVVDDRRRYSCRQMFLANGSSCPYRTRVRALDIKFRP